MTGRAHRAADAVAAAVGSALLLVFPLLAAMSATGSGGDPGCTLGESRCWQSPWTWPQLWVGAGLVWAAIAVCGYISMRRARRDPEPGAWL